MPRPHFQEPRVVSKLGGLTRIERLGLPHPDWRFVTTPRELPEQVWTDAPYGWTVRCAPSDRYAFWMPSSHHLRFTDIPDALQRFCQTAASDYFVVYPSWDSLLSGSCQVTAGGGSIELVRGEIAALLKGSCSPEVIVDLEPPLYIRRFVRRGDAETLPCGLIGRLGSAMRLASLEARFVTIEWVWARPGILCFYDWYQAR